MVTLSEHAGEDPDGTYLRMMRWQKITFFVMLALLLFGLVGMTEIRPFLIHHLGADLTGSLPVILSCILGAFQARANIKLQNAIFSRDHYERHQQRWLWQMLIFTAYTWLVTWYETTACEAGIFAGIFWGATLYLMAECFHHGPDESCDDEGCREMRHHAMQVGWRLFPIPAVLMLFPIYFLPHVAAIHCVMWIITLWATMPLAIYTWQFHRSGQGEEA